MSVLLQQIKLFIFGVMQIMLKYWAILSMLFHEIKKKKEFHDLENPRYNVTSTVSKCKPLSCEAQQMAV